MRLVKFIINLFQFNRTNWRAVLLCFLAATIFWLFNAFNKTYSTNIRFPLSFEYDQQRYAPSAQLPSTINLNVSGNGWDLFRKHFGIKVPELVIPLERPLEVKKIVATTLPPILASQIGALQINFVVTDTLQIQIDERDTHKFKVTVDVSELEFENGFGIVSPIVLLPDTISLEGPKKILHMMTDSIVVKIPAQKISETFREEIEVLVEESEYIKRNPPLIEVLFEVGPITRVEKKVKVITTSSVSTQDSVAVQFEIPSNLSAEFSQLTTLTAAIDVNRQASAGKLIPSIKGKPAYAKIISIDSVSYKLR